MPTSLFQTLTHETNWPLTRGLLATMGLLLALGAGGIAYRYHFEPRWRAEAEAARLPGYEGGYRTLRVYHSLDALAPKLGFRRLICGTAQIEGAERVVVMVLPYRDRRRNSALSLISQSRRTQTLPGGGNGDVVVLAPRRDGAWLYESLWPRLVALCMEGRAVSAGV